MKNEKVKMEEFFKKKSKTKDWIDREQGNHFCRVCNEEIEIKPWHMIRGIPEKHKSCKDASGVKKLKTKSPQQVMYESEIELKRKQKELSRIDKSNWKLVTELEDHSIIQTRSGKFSFIIKNKDDVYLFPIYLCIESKTTKGKTIDFDTLIKNGKEKGESRVFVFEENKI